MMQYLERTFRALGNRKRLEILRLLADGKPRAVFTIAKTIKLSQKSTSKHVNMLAQLDILERERRANEMYYSIGTSLPRIAKVVFPFIKK